MKGKKRGYLIVLLASTLVVGAAVGISLLASRQMTDQSHSASRFPVSIHEVMSTNTRYANAHGVCCDWIELYNSSGTDIDIGGYKLTDKSNEARYSVPNGTILPAGGYYVVSCLAGGGDGYADFGISRNGGETIILMNKKHVLVDSVTTLALEQNQSLARQPDGQWTVLDWATPGYENSEAGYAAYMAARSDVDAAVTISEALSSNTFYYNPDGYLCDFVELHNASAADVSLAGFMLTDSEQEIKFTFPADAVAPAGGYLVVYCSRDHQGPMYADFSLSRNGREEILLLNASMQVVDRMTTVAAPKNYAQVRDAQGAVALLDYATPGFPNTQEGYLACLQDMQPPSGSVVISEVMADNTGYPDATGALLDWIELHNTGSSSADISGYGLSDTVDGARYALPAGSVLEAGACLLVYCSPDGTGAGYAPFGLAADGGETVLLTDAAGNFADAVRTVAAPSNYAQARQADGTLAPDALATPGYPNTPDGYAAYQAQAGAQSFSVRIAEWMPANKSTLPDADGDFSDWIELENTGAAPLPLHLLYLSDDANDPYRYRLPDVTLAAGERIVVFCSGKMRADGGEMHAPFQLAKSGESILLTSAYGECLDSVTYASAQDDRAFAVDPDSGEAVVTAYPTPGFANTAAGYLAFLGSREPVSTLAISEVAPSNRSYLRQRRGMYYDFVELANLSGSPLSIGGYRLTDASDKTDMCVLPDVTLAAGETYIVFCSGDASLTTDAAFHANISLDAVEDSLFLYDAAGTLLDYVHIYDVPADGSIGRRQGETGFSVFEEPSPKAANTYAGMRGVPSEPPVADTAAGVYEGVGSLEVHLTAAGDIYYTTDGSKPTQASPRYTDAIHIQKTQVIRAISVETDKLPSESLTLSYIVNEGHTLPVVSLAIDPADFSGSARGIYANPYEDWERPAYISFFENGKGFSQCCGMRISGQTTRQKPHKSLKLVFEPKYGDGKLEYELFDGYQVTSFSTLQLRAGLDAVYSVFREAFYTQLAMPYKDTTLVQNSRMAVVYVNGEYYGLYIIMEAYSEDFYADYFDVSPDSVTIVKGHLYDETAEMYKLIDYAAKNDMSDAEHYRYLEERIDMDSLIDWMIFQAYYRNADLSGNVRYIKCSERGNKWQFAVYDVECGMRLAMPQSFASFGYVVAVGQTADLIAPLLKNATFRDRFLQRLAYHCKVTFERGKVLALFRTYTDQLEGEVERSFARWDIPVRSYYVNTDHIRRLVEDYDRPMQLIDDITNRLKLSEAEREQYFGELLHG